MRLPGETAHFQENKAAFKERYYQNSLSLSKYCNILCAARILAVYGHIYSPDVVVIEVKLKLERFSLLCKKIYILQ